MEEITVTLLSEGWDVLQRLGKIRVIADDRETMVLIKVNEVN